MSRCRSLFSTFLRSQRLPLSVQPPCSSLFLRCLSLRSQRRTQYTFTFSQTRLYQTHRFYSVAVRRLSAVLSAISHSPTQLSQQIRAVSTTAANMAEDVAMADFIDNAEPEEHSFDYDLIVIGGGSGGLASSKEAALLGKKVAVLDYVKPSPPGTTWGLGGTCVNVGCIPKKLMHHAALIGGFLEDAPHYGWELTEKPKHNWSKLVTAVQDYIHSLNWGYKTDLRQKEVEYINALGEFVDPHTIELTAGRNKGKRLTARRFIIAVGGRPRYPDIPGALEYGLTSDDLFSMERPPGKTLVVGASYVALECAGFLTHLGFDVTVMVRSILLRGFDQQMAELVGDYMSKHGTKFLRGSVPTRVDKLDSGRLKVTYEGPEGVRTDEFDTVLFAIGRDPDTKGLGLDKAGVKLEKDGKLKTVHERTNVPHIYAIGDVLAGKPELTPVAIKAGRFLAQRLYGWSSVTMDYVNVPTTIFTPLEYGCVGLAEEDAIKLYGQENVEVYHTYFKPLEWTVAEREDNVCYAKLVVNKNDNERVVGLHVAGNAAGEIVQGFAVAIKVGATKAHFDQTVGIHPIQAEEFTTLKITKSSGTSPLKTGC